MEALDFTCIAPQLYRLKVPFEDLYTAVFAIRCTNELFLVDCATTDSDVDRYILPFLAEIGCTNALTALLLTHAHADHAGGAARLRAHFPDLPIYCPQSLKTLSHENVLDGACFGNVLQAVSLPGHTRQCVGYLHLPTRTLLSGDCLQQRGVGKYRNGIAYPTLYRASLQRIRTLAPDRIIASHDYEPLGATAQSPNAVERYLTQCELDCPNI